MARGKKYLDNKQYAEAMLMFRRELQAKPGADVYYNLGQAYIAIGDRANAYRQFRKGQELDGSHPGLQLGLAELLVLSPDNELRNEAASLANSALKSAAHHSDAQALLALGEYQDGQKDRAKKRLSAALQAEPTHLRANVLLATIYAEAGDVRSGQQILEELHRRDPGSREAALALARYYAASREYQKAEQVLARAAAGKNVDAEMRRELAFLQLMNGKETEAEQNLARLASDKDQRYKSLLAIYLHSRGRRDAAIAALKRVVEADTNDRDARTRLVSWYLESNQPGEAAKLVDAALSRNSRDTPALVQRAQLRIAQNKLTDAGNDLNQVLRVEPDSAVAHEVLATLHAKAGKPLLQRQELAEALRLSPRSLRVRLQLADHLTTSGDPRAAMSVLAEAADDDKAALPWRVQRNSALLSMGDLEGARKGAEEGLAIARTRELLLQDAQVHLQLKNTRRARASGEEVLAKFPEDTGALRIISQSLVNEGRSDEALSRVRQHAGQVPNSPAVQHFLAGRLETAGKTDESRAVLESVVKRHPQFTPARFELLRLFARQGQFDLARRGAEELATVESAELPARLLLAEVQMAAENFGAAAEQYRRVLELEPSNTRVMNNLAYLLVDKLDQVDSGLQYAQKAKELSPENTSLDDTIGWAYLRKGLPATAVGYLEAAAARTTNPVVHVHLGLAYQKLGRLADARRVLRSALKSSPPGPETAMARTAFPDLP